MVAQGRPDIRQKQRVLADTQQYWSTANCPDNSNFVVHFALKIVITYKTLILFYSLSYKSQETFFKLFFTPRYYTTHEVLAVQYLHTSSYQPLVCSHGDMSNHRNRECCGTCVHKNGSLFCTHLYLRDKR